MVLKIVNTVFKNNDPVAGDHAVFLMCQKILY
jgi:hypothetical protein